MPERAETEMMNAEDVYIEPLPPDVCERCEEQDAFLGEGDGTPATKIVRVDIREVGTSILLGKFCDKCADAIANQVRGSLPPEKQ